MEKNARNRNRSERCDLFSSAWKRERESDTQRERTRERERKGKMSNPESSNVNLK